MRRSLPDAISSYKGTLRSAAGISARSLLLDVRLGLECVTPVVGGGVRSGEPDSVDGVRVPALRGQLRSWWRAVGDERDVDVLFDNEARVWGGVSVSAEQAALSSRVRIAVTDIKQGIVTAAGWHELTPRGRLGALPRWLGSEWVTLVAGAGVVCGELDSGDGAICGQVRLGGADSQRLPAERPAYIVGTRDNQAGRKRSWRAAIKTRGAGKGETGCRSCASMVPATTARG